jgi:hypothetical protein
LGEVVTMGFTVDRTSLPGYGAKVSAEVKRLLQPEMLGR